MNDVDRLIMALEQSIHSLNENLQQVRKIQENQQNQLNEANIQLAQLNAHLERHASVEMQTQQNAEDLARVRGIIWAVAIFTPPIAAIIGGIIAMLGPRLLG